MAGVISCQTSVCIWDFGSLLFSWAGKNFRKFIFTFLIKNKQTNKHPNPELTLVYPSSCTKFFPFQRFSKCMFPHELPPSCASAWALIQPHTVLFAHLLAYNVPWVCGNTGVTENSLHTSVYLSFRGFLLTGPGKIPSTGMLLYTYKIFILRLASQCTWDLS